MKNTARLQPFFIIFFVADSMITTKIVGRAAVGYEQKTRTTFLTTEQKSQVATNTLIKYFEQMIEKNILGIPGLERLDESPSIINPILPEQYHTSDLVDTFKSQLDTLLEKGKDCFNLARIKTWAQAKIQELESRERTRERVHEETREVHIPIRFVKIPAEKYVDAITHEEFAIAPGTEIQETPVTQFQWAQIMGENPSHFIDGIDSEEVLIGGEKIKMRPDAPVENVSYNQVQEFITKLNEHDKNNTNYIYALPSVQEYQALLQSALGSNWLEQIRRMKPCEDTEKTCTVASGEYMLTPNKQRVFGLVGHVWQWTRDMVELGKYDGQDVDAHVVFGGSYATCGPIINGLLRPIWYDGSIDKNIGVRLARHAKLDACEQPVAVRYCHKLLSWNEKDAEYDQAWHWNKKLGNLLLGADELAWMIKHKSGYPRETQHTIALLLQNVPYGSDPIVFLLGQASLDFDSQQIQDLSPFANLTNLTELLLQYNQIKDLTPLANLTNLNRLSLRGNQIKDLTPLANLTNLIMLDLRGNQITDLSPLANLTNLTKLELDNNQVKDLTPVANLINLASLKLWSNRINDLFPLANLTNLIMLDLGKNRIQDISPLASLTKLKWLFLWGNQIEYLFPLTNLTNLDKLSLGNNPIKDFSPLSQLKKLRLDLDQEQLAQLGTNVKLILPYADIEIV